MFGFLRLRRKGLSKRERALYNAHFCAACHGMAEFSGRLSSVLTNYDQTFLQIVFSALDPEGASAPERRACVAVPFRRIAVQPVSTEARPLLAALNLALIEAKLRDDVQDEGSRSARLGLRVVAGRATRAYQVLSDAGFPIDSIRALHERQRQAEVADAPTLASLSAPTGVALAEIFAFVGRVTHAPRHETPLRQVGDALGRFIYAWDALEDLESDARQHRFNAIRAALGEAWSRTRLRGFLTQQLRLLERGLDELPLGDRKALSDSLMRDLRARLDARLPGETVSLQALHRKPSSGGWLHALRGRARLQRGDCDCDCGGCDSCSGCEGCCDCSSCACDGASCCASGGCTFAQFLIAVAIILVIVVVIWFASRHGGASPSEPPAATFTRSVPTLAPSPLASPASSRPSPAARR